MNIWVGTSGWGYPQWKNSFYPKEVKQSLWLNYYAKSLNSVEINTSFYALPKPNILKSWCDITPNNFLFAVKAWNQITHKKRLKNCEENLHSFLDLTKILHHKCGPILFQLPGNFSKNLLVLKEFINLLPGMYQYVFEFRNNSWWCQETYNLLKDNNIAFCIFELGKLRSPNIITADFIYIRLHGSQEAYKGLYDEITLQKWAEWIKFQNKNTYIYFDNTINGIDAIQNAIDLTNIFPVPYPRTKKSI